MIEYEFMESDGSGAAEFAKVIEWATRQMEVALLGSWKAQRRTLARLGFRGRRGAVPIAVDDRGCPRPR